MFSSFDVCLLPTEFSEKKRGPIFPNEKTVRGAFADGTPKVKVQMSIAKKTNVYCQILMDCCVGEAKSEVGFQNDEWESSVWLGQFGSTFSRSKESSVWKPQKQFLMVNIKDCDNNFVKPRLPNNYKPNQASNYSHNGYLFNLEPGDYTIILVSYLLSTQAPGVVDGRKWLIRTVSPHASLAKLE